MIIVSTEDDWSATIKPRRVAAGADLDRVFQSVEPGGLEGTLSLPEDMKRLEELIRDHDVALIILDPLLTMVNAKLDTHKDAEVRIALEPVVAMAHAAKASLVGLVHVKSPMRATCSTGSWHPGRSRLYLVASCSVPTTSRSRCSILLAEKTPTSPSCPQGAKSFCSARSRTIWRRR